jgi:hypothetical protein
MMKEGTVPAPPYYPSAERDDDVVPFQELSHYGGAGAVYSHSSGSQSGTVRKNRNAMQQCHARFYYYRGKGNHQEVPESYPEHPLIGDSTFLPVIQ